MLLTSYSKEMFRPECNPVFNPFTALHTLTRISPTPSLPERNSGGFEYFKEPPAVTFRIHGKIITVHPREIAVNALKDEEEADKILQWLQREINDAWEKRDDIKPKYEGLPKPKLLEILKLLPKTNCRECGNPPAWSLQPGWRKVQRALSSAFP